MAREPGLREQPGRGGDGALELEERAFAVEAAAVGSSLADRRVGVIESALAQIGVADPEAERFAVAEAEAR